MRNLTEIKTGKHVEFVLTSDVEKFNKKHGADWFKNPDLWDLFAGRATFTKKKPLDEIDGQIEMSYELSDEEQEKVDAFAGVHSLSSGTICSITGVHKYEEIDELLNYIYSNLARIPIVMFRSIPQKNLKMIWDWYQKEKGEAA